MPSKRKRLLDVEKKKGPRKRNWPSIWGKKGGLQNLKKGTKVSSLEVRSEKTSMERGGTTHRNKAVSIPKVQKGITPNIWEKEKKTSEGPQTPGRGFWVCMQRVVRNQRTGAAAQKKILEKKVWDRGGKKPASGQRKNVILKADNGQKEKKRLGERRL